KPSSRANRLPRSPRRSLLTGARIGHTVRRHDMEKDTARNLRVKWSAISEIKRDPRNPKQHSARQIRQIADSIKIFGCLVPVLIDRDNKILSGHGRVLALRRLGWVEVPVIRAEHLTPEKARAFSIADNRLTELSSWDERMLGEILHELSAV